MGQGKDHQDLQGHDRGIHPQRKAIRGYLAALGSLGLLATLVLAQQQVKTRPPSNGPIQSTPQWQFDKSLAWKALVKQCDFGPRNSGGKGWSACKDYLVAEVKKSCDDVQTDDFTHRWSTNDKNVPMTNIVGTQNWKDAKTRVLLIAHWDTRPTSDMDPRETNLKLPILGANDGASGVAVLLELMRAVKGRLPKNIGVMYLLTDGEDLGPGLEEMFLGAVRFTKKMPTPKPDYGILLDMIGDRDLKVPMEPNSQRYAPSLLKQFYLNASQNGLRETFPMVPGPMIEDDHIPINEAGLPTIDLIDFDYEAWHTQADTVDKCSAESLGKIGIALESWLLKSPSFEMPK